MEGGTSHPSMVVKVELIRIITYGPYLRIGNYADKMVWESGVVKIGIEGAIAKVGVTRGDKNYNCIIVSISVGGIKWRK